MTRRAQAGQQRLRQGPVRLPWPGAAGTAGTAGKE